MKTIIKIVLALVIITGSFQAGRVYLTNYQFQDAIHEGMLRDPRASDAELVEMVVTLAKEFDLPVEEKDVTVHASGADVNVKATYTRNVALLPRIYGRDWMFTAETSNRLLVTSRRE